MNEVEKIFKDVALIRGGILLLKKENAIELIQMCKMKSIKILGIDGFYITKDTTQPSMENSIDFSSSEGDNTNAALEFINKQPDNLYYEIVCE